MSSPSIKEMVLRGREIIDARHDWGYDRDAFLNSSEAGYCIRRLWYGKHQPELAAPDSWGYARRGSHAEKYLVESILATNQPLLWAGTTQVAVQDEKRRLSANPDGCFVYGGEAEDHGVEFKSIDPRTNRKNLPKAEHIVQFQMAMALVNQQHNLEVKKGTLVYMDASNFDEIDEFEVDVDMAILDRMAKKAKKVFTTKNVDSLDREGVRNGGCKYCLFTGPCGVTPTEAAGRKKANRGSNLDADVQRIMEVKKIKSDAETEEKVLKASIGDELTKRKTNSVVVGDVTVQLAEVAGRTTIDKKSMTADGIDLSKYEKVGKPSTRLTVEQSS